MRYTLLFITLFIAFEAKSQWKTSDATLFQKELNEWFMSEESPLSKKELKKFKGLSFYPIDSTYIVSAVFVRAENARAFQMKTTRPRNAPYLVYGVLNFKIKGKSFSLNVYESADKTRKPDYADYLIVPFTDKTNKKDTYKGGRYVGFWKSDISENESFTLNFNLAYNPSCAYNPKYSCIIPPPENHLSHKIKAGVKKWH